MRQYIYKVSAIERIVDGDTYWLHLDVGFRQNQLTCIRLAGYDTPEKVGGSALEKAKANQATAFVIDWLKAHEGHVWVETEKDPDSFGRWLGRLIADDSAGCESTLGAALDKACLAVVWPTRWRHTYDS